MLLTWEGNKRGGKGGRKEGEGRAWDGRQREERTGVRGAEDVHVQGEGMWNDGRGVDNVKGEG